MITYKNVVEYFKTHKTSMKEASDCMGSGKSYYLNHKGETLECYVSDSENGPLYFFGNNRNVNSEWLIEEGLFMD